MIERGKFQVKFIKNCSAETLDLQVGEIKNMTKQELKATMLEVGFKEADVRR